MKGLKKMAAGLRSMSRPAEIILEYSLALSCALLAASLLLFVSAGAFGVHTYRLHYLARDLYNTPAALLLVASIGSVCAEDAVRRRGP